MNINTVSIKQQQLAKGFFTVGSGAEVILVMGSCRVVAYVQYLHDWNEANGNRFTIHSLDPFNFNWDVNDDRVDYMGALKQQETNMDLIKMIRTVNIFIHEWYQNAGMFNCDKNAENGIYDFGMAAPLDICIPSFNDIFVMFGDIVTFDVPARKMAIQDWNVLGKLSEQTIGALSLISQKNLQRFYDVCQKSDVPEMAVIVMANSKKARYWWSYNHTSKNFTLAIFKLVNDKFLHLDLSNGFDENHVDMFANNYTKLTQEDVNAFGYQWDEEIISIKAKLF